MAGIPLFTWNWVMTTITTDDKGLIAGEVKINTMTGAVPAYRAAPAGKWSITSYEKQDSHPTSVGFMIS